MMDIHNNHWVSKPFVHTPKIVLILLHCTLSCVCLPLLDIITLMCVCVLSSSVMSDSFQPHGLQFSRLLHPWDFPGKNTGVGCHSLFQGIFLTQGSILSLLHCRQILYNLSYQGSPCAHTWSYLFPSWAISKTNRIPRCRAEQRYRPSFQQVCWH